MFYIISIASNPFLFGIAIKIVFSVFWKLQREQQQLIPGKFLGQNKVLAKYHLEPHDAKYIQMIENTRFDDMLTFRRRLMAIESKFTDEYFNQVFSLFINPTGYLLKLKKKPR